MHSSVLAGIPGVAQGSTTAQSVSHRCWQHRVRHNEIVSTGDFLVADCSSSPPCAMSNARCGRQSDWVLLVAGSDEGRSHVRMLRVELLLGEPYIIVRVQI